MYRVKSILCRAAAVAALSCTFHGRIVAAEPVPKGKDFVTPTADSPRVMKEAAPVVAENGPAIDATAADAFAAADQEIKLKEIKGNGVEQVKLGDGIGFLARATATYGFNLGPDATKIDRRNAYVKALATAKVELGGHLKGMSVTEKQNMHSILERNVLSKETLVNLKSEGKDEIECAMECLLDGYVVFEVADDITTHTVSVSIATSNKTCGVYNRLADNQVTAGDLTTALKEVLVELKKCVIPPVGNKIIHIKKPDEICLIGFGSELVGTNPNRQAQAELRINAITIATMRARAEVVALLNKDAISWHGGFRQYDEKGLLQFVKDANRPEVNHRLDKELETFQQETSFANFIDITRQGMLPPGVIVKTYIDEESGWVYAVALFSPSATAAAMNLGKKADNALPAGPAPIPAIPNSAPDKPGPTGIVTDPKKLCD